MAYNPGIQYRGDQYAFQGITGAASALAAGIDESRKKREQMEKEQALNDPIMKHAAEKGLVSDEDYTAYMGATHSKKQSIANGLMANMASDFARQKFEASQAQQEQEMALRLKLAQMRGGGGGGAAFAPPPEQVERLLSKGIELVPTRHGGLQVVYTNKSTKSQKPYTMDDLDAEAKLESGGNIADWTRVEEHEVKDGYRIAKIDDGKGGTKNLKIREDRYQGLVNKYRGLTGESAPLPAPAKTEDELADEWLAQNPDSPFAEAVKKKRLGLP